MSQIAVIVESDTSSPGGFIADAATSRGFSLHRVQVNGRGEAFDQLPDPDIIVVTGSDEHWYEIDDHPHLQAELAFLQRAITRGTPILGLCFGGQGIAMAMGAEVKPMGLTEIGWHEVESRIPDLVPAGPWFEWHSDAFDLPTGAELVARNDVSLQAFRYGPHLGLQFHPEVGPEVLRPWIDHASEFGADPQTLMAETERLAGEARGRAFELFDRFLGL
ncbi:MAG: hypothetical protein OEM97_05530 [Acidimicrobiia bacterium]|nr:hypothetical protein [Acidimicrobiia bacterium]